MHLSVDLAAQRLRLHERDAVVAEWPVSTAANGAGEIQGSGCTPRGRHVVRAKIGAGAPEGTVFKSRRVAEDVPRFSAAARAEHPGRDWILSRILWLSGTEPGVNRLGCVDTMRRYIYIHGTPELDSLGRPASHGCIRMACADLITLFERVSAGTTVTIHE